MFFSGPLFNSSFSLSISKYILVPSKYVFELSSLTISLVCNWIYSLMVSSFSPIHLIASYNWSSLKSKLSKNWSLFLNSACLEEGLTICDNTQNLKTDSKSNLYLLSYVIALKTFEKLNFW